MKNTFSIAIIFALTLSVTCVSTVFGQTVKEMKVIVPFQSLQLTDVKADGNKKTGLVEITMNFKNGSSKNAGVSLSIGGFDDLGITDIQGKKYKLFTQNNAINTNKGFQNIPFVQFGDKKSDWVATLKQEIPQGENRKLTLKIKSDPGTKVITDFHIRCILSLDYEHIGDKIYRVENIPIEWK